MTGRLSTPPGFTPYKLKGLWKREQRHYFLVSLSLNGSGSDKARADRLLRRLSK